MSWRDCFRLQRVTDTQTIIVTPFGRALRDRGWLGPAGTDAPNRYEMIYWLKLPVFEHRYHAFRDNYCMMQAMLVFHGHTGFAVHWLPVQDTVETVT